MSYVNKLSERCNIWGDGIAKVERWDFSKANMNEEARIEAITKVASICYDNPNVVGKASLYNRLKAESMGLPSSSFEFVPVLLNETQVIPLFEACETKDNCIPHSLKYGILVGPADQEVLLTNYRALLYDSQMLNLPDIAKVFNTEEECEIIKQNIYTFLYKMDISTSKQHVRHRVSHQEMSRRYVSGKKAPFEFYYSKALREHKATKGLFDTAVSQYYTLLKDGVQPQEARRVLPQAMYTTIWSAFNKPQIENYINLRADKHAQWEIQQIAIAMRDMIKI